MNLMPMGDYYLWLCRWCDSTNRTIWTRLEKNDMQCSACKRQAPLNSSNTLATTNQAMQRCYILL